MYVVSNCLYLVDLGGTGFLTRFAESLETDAGLQALSISLASIPNVIAASLGVAVAMRAQIQQQPNRRMLFSRATAHMQDISTEFSLFLDIKISRLDRDQQKKYVRANVSY